MRSHLALRGGIISLAFLAGAVSTPLAAPIVPPGFSVENAVPNVTFAVPTAIAFLPDGRMLVAEKRGKVWVVENGIKRTPALWSADTEVLNNGDRGLVGMAVDPNYATNRRLYFFYSVDPDSDGVDSDSAAFGRLTRYETRADAPNTLDLSTRTILMGTTWSDGSTSASLSHASNCLRFGEDGTLLVSIGDGAHYETVDPGGHDPEQFEPGKSDPAEDVGSFRSQYLESLNGKILRINPETGHGYASNPYVVGSLGAPRSKVWAYGFRNPFRFCVRPGTGSPDTSDARPGALFVGDVGLNTWEEIDLVTQPGSNHGWPCWEGREPQPLYSNLSPAHSGCTSIGSPENPALPTPPLMTWHHGDSTLSSPAGLMGNCTSGGVFYTAERYPAHYRGRFFFGDFGKGWVRAATLDSSHQVVQLQEFASGLEGPVDWAVDPVSGELFYISIYRGEVRRFRYAGNVGSDLPPVARASAVPTIGAVPAPITFSSLGSYDPEGAPLHYAWNFADGSTGSLEPHPSHEFIEAGDFRVVLTVSDDHGSLARDTVEIVITSRQDFPSTAVLDSFPIDGPLGTPWGGSVAGLAVSGGALVQSTSPSYAIWDGMVYAPTQEAFVTLDSLTADAPEHALLLKTQGLSWATGTVQVVYAAAQQVVVASTYESGVGWVRRGGPWRVAFGPGDQLGARAYANGVLVVYRNGVSLGSASFQGWKYYDRGGRIGIKLVGAARSRLDRFGGGNVPIASNTPPVATILEPRRDAFYVAGDQITLHGAVDDAETDPTQVGLEWNVSLLHNNHIHPSILNFEGPTASFTVLDHDDGTGVSHWVRLIATDRGGLADTAEVTIHPEVDLEPSRVSATPSIPTPGGVVQFSFTLHNHGRMTAPFSRWALIAGATTIAQGDTLVPARDSVRVTRSLTSLPAGAYTLRLVADTMNTVFETVESNNAASRPFVVLEFPNTATLDGFARQDAPITTPWVGSLAALAVRSNALVQTPAATNSYAVWNGAVFGPDQEAFVRFDSLTATATEHDLLLKVQGTSWSAGAIQVVHSAPLGTVVVNSYVPGVGFTRRGGPFKVTYAPGDEFGARALPDGSVRVFKNGVRIGECGLGNWPFAANGGRIGVMLVQATRTRFTAFGGGAVRPNTPPTATIVEPRDGAFYVAGQPIPVRGAGADGETDPVNLDFRWNLVTQKLHDSHVHTETSAAWGALTSILAAGEPDSAAHEEIAISSLLELVVTDRGGLSGTASVVLYPEVDLEPASVTTLPAIPPAYGPSLFTFTLRNHGRMSAPSSHWTLFAGATLIAEGDTLVGARDSVSISRRVAWLPAGTWAVRLVVDTTRLVPETNEANNVFTRPVATLDFPSTPTLDDFARPDGVIAAPWAGSLSGLAVRNSALVQNAPNNYAVWNGGVFGPDQEAYVRFDSLTASAPEHDLLLKVQGTTWTAGAIQVVYCAPQGIVVVNTYTPGAGFLRRGGPWKVGFGSGDTFGARALPDGSVRVFKNGARVGECSVAAWPFAASGGRIGMILQRANATRLMSFGGGNNRPPGPATFVSPSVQSEPAEVALDRAGLPARLALSNPYPNPARGATQMALELPRPASVGVTVIDLQGRVVWSEEAREMPAGRWTLHWTGRDITGSVAPPGIYFAQVAIDGARERRRIVVVR